MGMEECKVICMDMFC